MGPSRFDYIKYDDTAVQRQGMCKEAVLEVEECLNLYVVCEESKKKAMQALEECYMWIGKGIRNDQVNRNKFYELQEGRKND